MKTPDGITSRIAGTLRAAIAGEVFLPGDPGYDQARRAWILAVDERPAVVVEAETAADVAQAVRPLARDADRPAGHRARRRAA
jgi:hypothetical protein